MCCFSKHLLLRGPLGHLSQHALQLLLVRGHRSLTALDGCLEQLDLVASFAHLSGLGGDLPVAPGSLFHRCMLNISPRLMVPNMRKSPSFYHGFSQFLRSVLRHQEEKAAYWTSSSCISFSPGSCGWGRRVPVWKQCKNGRCRQCRLRCGEWSEFSC